MEATTLSAATTPVRTGAHRFAMLDGWRAVSILLVLAGHLLPLGPSRLGLNAAVAEMGMALFFTLSGFLITRFLAEAGDLRVFIIRRFFRIVPLAWVASLVALPMAGAAWSAYPAHLLFYANLPPVFLVDTTAHLWSLCVEMQFYVAAAALVAVGGRRALGLLPLFALAVTIARIASGTPVSIVTWFRIDEILAGGILALSYGGWFGPWPMRVLGKLNVYVLTLLLLACCRDLPPGFTYLRPYLAAATVGASLVNAPPLLARLFESRAAGYIATISYALYIVHGVVRFTWLGSGPRLIHYAKLPLLLAVTFGLAHVSTFRFEQPCIAWAKRLTRRFHVRPAD